MRSAAGDACSWANSIAYPIAISDQATVSLGGRLYSFGGLRGPFIVNSYKFDSVTWTPIASLPSSLERPLAVSDGIFIYVLGGEITGTGTYQTTVYRYNTLTDSYTTMAPSITGNRTHTTVYLNGKIYRFAGYGTISDSTDVLEIYDIASNSWALGAPYPMALSNVSAFGQGNFIYGAGGIRFPGLVPSTKTYRYDPVSNTWDDAAIADLPETRWGATSSKTGYGSGNGWILAGGYVNGSGDNDVSVSVISWDPVDNSWASLPGLASRMYSGGGAILGNSYYVIGGMRTDGNGSNTTQRLTCISGASVIDASPTNIIAESCGTANGLPDPGENLDVNLDLRNIGDLAITDLTVTLQPTGGVTNPSLQQSYGSLPSLGPVVGRSFRFTVDPNLVCGAPLVLTFVLNDGVTNYPNVTRQYISGVRSVTYEESFEGAIIPALPAGWTTAHLVGTALNWVTFRPSALAQIEVRAKAPSTVNLSALISPPIVIQSPESQLKFRQRLQTFTTTDGMVLEFTTDAGATWTDVIDGGGTFETGGYTGLLSTENQNPLSGRNAWSGDSGGSIITVVNLPAALYGQTVQFRWLMGSDAIGSDEGVQFDDVYVLGPRVCNRCGSIIPQKTVADFDGDGKSDLSVFRSQNDVWYILGSSNGVIQIQQFGLGNDELVPGDYDGDSKTDIAVFRDGDWYVLKSSTGNMTSKHFGAVGDVPTAADYDGDGLTDFSVFRPAAGVWYFERSSDSVFVARLFGATGDLPVPGDYDGDGKAQIAMWRPSTGDWTISINSSANYSTVHYGGSGDRPVQCDYDGDGKTDLAVFQPSTGYWFIKGSTGSDQAALFGVATDVAIPGDYDGDGKADIAYFRPSDGSWNINPSLGGASVSVHWGQAGDKPVPAAYLPEQ